MPGDKKNDKNDATTVSCCSSKPALESLVIPDACHVVYLSKPPSMGSEEDISNNLCCTSTTCGLNEDDDEENQTCAKTCGAKDEDFVQECSPGCPDADSGAQDKRVCIKIPIELNISELLPSCITSTFESSAQRSCSNPCSPGPDPGCIPIIPCQKPPCYSKVESTKPPKPKCAMDCCSKNGTGNTPRSSQDIQNGSKQSSKVRMMPCASASPRRQGSSIASETSQVMTSVLCKNKGKEKKDKKKKAKNSKTSLKTVPSKAAQGKENNEACTCHFPPAYSEYFNCTGDITGTCCCSQNK